MGVESNKLYEILSIADHIGVSPSTGSREVRRNSLVSIDYQAGSAQDMSYKRTKRSPYKIKEELRELIVRGLRERHSPEQICGTLTLKSGRNVISHQAVYKFIYSKRCTDYEPLIQYLRIRHKKKYSERGSVQKRGVIPNRVGIEYRPAIVETNTEIGHWERSAAAG